MEEVARISDPCNLVREAIMMKSAFKALATLLATAFSSFAADFYVATNGVDSNPGTIGAPFATIEHAVSLL